MRVPRAVTPIIIAGLVASMLALPSGAQTTDLERRLEAAEGLVDTAVAQRSSLEAQLAQSIANLADLGAELSAISSKVDSLRYSIGFADIQLSGIETQLADHAVAAYMGAVSYPSISIIITPSLESAMVASKAVGDVVGEGMSAIDSLVAQRRQLEQLRADFLADQEEVAALQAEMDAEVERLASLYDQADRSVADAIRAATSLDAQYRASLDDVARARAAEEERRRQEERQGPPTTSPPTTTPTTNTTVASTTTTTAGGGGGWVFPPAVEQWRGLVQQYFPSNRVEEALRIIQCESLGDPNAYNPYSGASGLFQFIPSTWATAAPKAGFPDSSPFEPVANIATAAWLANRYQELGQNYWQAWSCRRVL